MNASISIHTMLLILRVVMRTIIVTPQPIVLLTAPELSQSETTKTMDSSPLEHRSLLFS